MITKRDAKETITVLKYRLGSDRANSSTINKCIYLLEKCIDSPLDRNSLVTLAKQALHPIRDLEGRADFPELGRFMEKVFRRHLRNFSDHL